MFRKTFVIAAALALSGCGLLKNSSDPTPVPSPNVVNYTAVGASDAIGIGASVPCFLYSPCPTGTGYVQLIQQHLQTDGKTVTMENLGIPGAVLSPEIEAIGNSVGLGILSNFMDSEMTFVPTNSTLVTVFAGGNDVNTIGRAVDDGLGGSDPNGYIQTQIQHFGANMNTLVSTIKTRAPNARVVVLNLPNLAALPYSAGDTLAQKQGIQTIAVGFSGQINALKASQGALIVDLMCNPTFYIPSSFSSDGFHPNDAGYAYLASIIYPIATTGTAPAPQASCAQMTIY